VGRRRDRGGGRGVDRPLGDHRQQAGGAELGRFLHQPVGRLPLDRRKGEPDVGDRLGLARAAPAAYMAVAGDWR